MSSIAKSIKRKKRNLVRKRRKKRKLRRTKRTRKKLNRTVLRVKRFWAWEVSSNFMKIVTPTQPFYFPDVQPIFGVSLGLAVVRSPCHDSVNLPLIVRNCIDFLQESGLSSEHLYRTDAVKTKLQQLKKQYNNRDSDNIDFDVPTACSLLKMYLKWVERILNSEESLLKPLFEFQGTSWTNFNDRPLYTIRRSRLSTPSHPTRARTPSINRAITQLQSRLVRLAHASLSISHAKREAQQAKCSESCCSVELHHSNVAPIADCDSLSLWQFVWGLYAGKVSTMTK